MPPSILSTCQQGSARDAPLEGGGVVEGIAWVLDRHYRLQMHFKMHKRLKTLS